MGRYNVKHPKTKWCQRCENYPPHSTLLVEQGAKKTYMAVCECCANTMCEELGYAIRDRVLYKQK